MAREENCWPRHTRKPLLVWVLPLPEDSYRENRDVKFYLNICGLPMSITLVILLFFLLNPDNTFLVWDTGGGDEREHHLTHVVLLQNILI